MYITNTYSVLNLKLVGGGVDNATRSGILRMAMRQVGQSRPLLRDEPAGNKRVRCWHKRICLHALLQQVARATRLKLQAAPALQHEKVCVLTNGMPAIQLLQHLSTLIPARWETHNDGYLLQPLPEIGALEKDFVQQLHQARFQLLKKQLLSEPLNKEPRSPLNDLADVPPGVSAAIQRTPFQGLEDLLIWEWLHRWSQERWKQLWQGEAVFAAVPVDRQSTEIPADVLKKIFNSFKAYETDNIRLLADTSEEAEKETGALLVRQIWLVANISLDRSAFLMTVGFELENGKIKSHGISKRINDSLLFSQPSMIHNHPLVKRWLDWQTSYEAYRTNPLLQQNIPDFEDRALSATGWNMLPDIPV